MCGDFAKISKFLSLVLRHQPEKIGIQLDPSGWVEVRELLARLNGHGMPVDRSTLQLVVETNDKKRFTFSEDGTRIRAAQGHSVEIDLALTSREPPARLYHGTASRFLESIRVSGLLRGERQHVHLSPDDETARKVGMRHGVPVVLVVRAAEMYSAGTMFFLSDNGVWLTETVPPQHLIFEPDLSE